MFERQTCETKQAKKERQPANETISTANVSLLNHFVSHATPKKVKNSRKIEVIDDDNNFGGLFMHLNF